MNTDSSRACRVLPGRAGATDPPVQVLHRAGCPASGPYPCLQWMGEKVVSSRGAGGQEWAALTVRTIPHLQGQLRRTALRSTGMDNVNFPVRYVRQSDTERCPGNLSPQLKGRLAVSLFPADSRCWPRRCWALSHYLLVFLLED